MKTIPLSQDYIALVDDEDFEYLSQFKWYAAKRGRKVYAATKAFRITGLLHRFLLPDCPTVDHRDGDGLNNQRFNLRAATYAQNNQAFKRKTIGTYSGFRGVTWFKRDGIWQAQIKVDGKRIYLGRFEHEVDAARAYDTAAIKYWGEWASPNFP